MNIKNKKLHTKWGTAKNYGGYWRINSREEGNCGYNTIKRRVNDAKSKK